MADTGKQTTGNETPNTGVTDRQTYNIVSDTVVGANFRLRDNVIQAIAIFVSLCVGAIIGAVAVEEQLMGALVGGFLGMIAGLFGSGIFLMIYRAVRHMRGRHD